VPDSAISDEAFGGRDEVRYSDVLEAAPVLLDRYNAMVAALGGSAPNEEQGRELDAVGGFLENAFQRASSSSYVVWIPPPDAEQEEWLDFGEALLAVRDSSPEQLAQVVGVVRSAEAVVDAVGDPAALEPAVAAWTGEVREQALARGEAEKIPLEVSYLRADYFGNALVLYLIAFVLVALVWLRPRNRWLARGAMAATLVPTALVVWGIGVRCVLRGRPPVSTLYETILFITACAVIVALIAEFIHKQRIALSLGAMLGAIGMFLAYRFELTDGADTMPQLVAVLDTNYYLAIHVTTVTIGYAAGILAGFIGYIFLLGKLLGWRGGDARTYKLLGRMLYGVLCFGLLFSTFGTIYGGVWANDSWGRFWGWDPKENGALMIVLWELMILHGRMGGLWQNWGTALLAVLGNIVVAFSWWGVNLMGVGLHSYGFTAGLKQAVTAFYVLNLAIAGLGVLAWYLERRRLTEPARASAGEHAGKLATDTGS
jgi:ABC-type transport system involved in cytochrome c biogenesis permease subunit